MSGRTPKRARSSVKLSGGTSCSPAQVELWRKGTLCDVTVTSGEVAFPAHKLVLAAGSSTLRGLLTSEMCDSEQPSLPSVPADAFSVVLEWLYTGASEAEESLLPELLRVANYLDVPGLKDAIVVALQKRLCPENALDLWGLGDHLVAPALAESAKRVALAHFEELKDFLAAAPVDHVQALLSDERLVASSEEVVFTAVARLVEAQNLAEGTMLELMRHVRFACMRREFLEQTVYTWPQLQTVAGSNMLRDSFMPIAIDEAPRTRRLTPQQVSDGYVLGHYTWTIEMFSKQTERILQSPCFASGPFSWCVRP